MDDMERMKISEFKNTASTKLREIVAKPKVLESDGEDVCVVMSLEEFARTRPFKSDGLMLRHEGKLFKEVK